MANKLFVFDLDDTLIDNVHDYAEPILDATRLIVKTLCSKAPHVSKIIAMEQEIDGRRVKEINPQTAKPFGFSMERFPGTLVETYREICRQAAVPCDSETEAALYKIGLQAFGESMYARNINPDAATVLDFLRRQGDVLFLCTKGDFRVQTKKISALREGAGGDLFNKKVYVVDEKNPDVFRGFARGFERRALFSVGNSYDSDIKPALEVGFKGIFIPVETWETIDKMDEILSAVDRERCWVFKNLTDIMNEYERLS